MSFVERSIILCPYLGGSIIGGSIVIVLHNYHYDDLFSSIVGRYCSLCDWNNSDVVPYHQCKLQHYD